MAAAIATEKAPKDITPLYIYRLLPQPVTGLGAVVRLQAEAKTRKHWHTAHMGACLASKCVCEAQAIASSHVNKIK